MPWVMLAVTIFGAIQSYQAGKQQEALAREQAALADRNMVLANEELGEQIRRQSEEDKRVRSTALARAAASGAELSGSPLAYLDYMEEEQGRQLNWMKTAGASRIRLQNEGDQIRASAGIMKGKNQQWDALFTGVSGAAGISNKYGLFT